MKNDYEVRGDVTAIIINSPKHGRQEALISTSKLDRAKEWQGSWHVVYGKTAKTFYVNGNLSTKMGNRGTISLHRWLTEALGGFEVDHINHNGLINTDENLRIATVSENQQNRRCAKVSNHSSHVRGVSWHKATGRWMAKIVIDRKQIYLGTFDDITEADIAVKEAREKHMPFSKEAS